MKDVLRERKEKNSTITLQITREEIGLLCDDCQKKSIDKVLIGKENARLKNNGEKEALK